MVIDLKCIKNIVTKKITANGFNTSEIDLHTELLKSGYLDSLDVAEILQEIEVMIGTTTEWETEDEEEIICLDWFVKISNL